MIEDRKIHLEILPIIYVLSIMYINIGYVPLNYKNIVISTIISLVTVFSMYYFYRGTDKKHINYTNIKHEILSRFRPFFYPVIVVFIIELANMDNLYQLRMPMFFIVNMASLWLVLSFTIRKNNLEKFLYLFYKIQIIILGFSVLLSILILILPHEILYVDDAFFMTTKHVLGISLRQQIYRSNGRLFSFFNNPSHFGEFGYLTLFLIIINFRMKLIDRKKFISSLLLVIFSFMFSKARAPIISSIIFIILLYILERYLFNAVPYGQKNIILLGIFIMSIVLFYSVKSRSGALDNGRFDLYSYSWSLIKLRPILGHGTKNFYNLISKKFDNAHAHNSYIQLWASGGIVYLLTYLAYYLKAITYSFFSIEKNKDLFLPVLSFLLSTLFFQLFDNKVLGVHPQFSYFIVCYYIANLFYKDKAI